MVVLILAIMTGLFWKYSTVVKVAWSAADAAWELRLPYVRWITLSSQAVVSLLACLTVSQLVSLYQNISHTHRAVRCAFGAATSQRDSMITMNVVYLRLPKQQCSRTAMFHSGAPVFRWRHVAQHV